MRKLLIAPLLLVLLSSGCAWLRGNSSSDNVEEPTELADITPTIGIQQLWSRGMGEVEERHGLRKSPAVDADRVYVGDLEGRLRALDASGGNELWRADTGLQLSSAVAVGEGLAVVGALDGEVLAVDPGTGAERWRARVSSEVLAQPVISRGTVVVRSHDGRLFGFDAATGERRWLYDRGLPSLTLRGNAAPVAAAGTVYAGYDDGQVVALRLEDGSVVWEQRIAVGEGRTDLQRMVDIDGQLGVGPSEIYAVSYQGQVAALAAESGSPLWSREFSSYGGVSLAGDRVLVTTRDGTVFALDRRSGGALWKLEALLHRWPTTPAVHGNHAVVGDLEGWLHWIDLDSGQLAARSRVGRDPIRAMPVVSNDVLYAMTVDGELAAYRIGAR